MDKHGTTRTLDVKALRATTARMRAAGEGVHDAGWSHRRKTGTIHQLVDVRQNRGSHNAMIPGDEGNFILSNGIALPILSLFDGTGSTSRWLEDFFHAAERQYLMFGGARPRYNTQLASGVVQDVDDRTEVVQISQFESDERSAEQVRLLIPASDGGDAPEDYDLGLAMGLFIYADLWTYYGLKGYLTLTADEVGRGFVTREDVKRYLGQSLDQVQSSRLSISEIGRMLSDHWHLFLLQVPSSSQMLSYTTRWWTEALGSGRVIRVPDPSLLAEVRAGLVYVTESNRTPTQQGLSAFLQEGNQTPISKTILAEVWRILQDVEEHFGAQAALPGYHDIPLPGDVFAHYRHAWPIGHSRAGENVTPAEAS